MNILVVNEGATQSVALSTDERMVLHVFKYNPETDQWNELFLVASGSTHFFTDMKTSISLDNKNFTVQNATKADEGLYRVTSHLYGTCLAQINVTFVLGKLQK